MSDLPPPPPPLPRGVPPLSMPGWNVYEGPRSTERLAVTSMVAGIVAPLLGVFIAAPAMFSSGDGAVLWLICGIGIGTVILVSGIVSLRRIGRSGGRLTGTGMAVTGIVLGGVLVAGLAVIALGVVMFLSSGGLE